ncbi:hypothetical protein [Allokutzneria albata]|uniref:Uncharacterized protein n=1 Tax=Allokutzneria albata TaxID=211114 RepID=A0A1G9W6E5_ALLAB|nr:hypothetical protein [Allokutzneria albata]SDM80092.1 hypothetical protein SAMN04489726_3424 [Allokutzneria albata]
MLAAPLIAMPTPAQAALAGESVQEVLELAAWTTHHGRRINPWALRTPPGDRHWHGHLEYGVAGDEVWTENWW